MTTESIHETVREHYAGGGRPRVPGRGLLQRPRDDRREPLLGPRARRRCPMPPSSPPSAAATRPRSPTCTRASACSTSGPGGGIDVLLSAKRVGPTGRAFGLDMTDEMLALAQRNAADAGATNVEFLKGHIEAIPLPAESIDVVISNCVVNLAADKPAVFAEIARVLRPGGPDRHQRHRRRGLAHPRAASRARLLRRLHRRRPLGLGVPGRSPAVGLTDVSITPSHTVTDGMVSAIIKATKPADARR